MKKEKSFPWKLKKGLNSKIKTAIEQEISVLIKKALEGSSNFETLETFVRNTSLRIGAGILKTLINSDKDDCQPTLDGSGS